MPDGATALRTHERWLRVGLIGLLTCTALAYLPSLGGGFLNWDDPWLLESNRFFQEPSLRGLRAIWTDLSLPTRLTLGAEYLPLRDTSHLIEASLFGVAPLPLRVVNLAIYLSAVAVLHRSMRAVLQSEMSALIVAAAFALHPVHVESVAWLAGRKDVLAMLFVALAVHAYTARGSLTMFWTPLWFLLAMLSKSMSVVLPLLLPLFDMWGRRRPNYRVVLASLLAVAVVMPLHLYVGRLVGMSQPYSGVSAMLATMGPVWARYVGILLWPRGCSLVHDVPFRTTWGVVPTSCYLLILFAVVAALSHWRKGKTGSFLTLGFLFIPLLPVGQVLAPLQNIMADRYLWWSVLACGVTLVRLYETWPKLGASVCLCCFGFWLTVTAHRSTLFGDSVLVFADAVRKTSRSGVAPYQLAMALEEQGAIQGARDAYEEGWRRSGGRDETARRATNNLARLEVRQGNLARAEWVLRRGLQQFPRDSKMQNNLAKVLAKRPPP
jgi:protein O-mannosyl-transferase